LSKLDRIAIASLWTKAMSTKNIGPLNALAKVMADDVRTTNLRGRDDVLKWFKTYTGMSMFRTGRWQKPRVEGAVVTFVNQFDEKAAFYQGAVAITVSPQGLITEARTTILPAPDPLGSVIMRVWGPRASADTLLDHLAETYGVKARTMKQLDHGVFRVDLEKGDPWIVRLFPGDRPIGDVKGDATVLKFLESQDFPAERVVAEVSEHEGQGVLVTSFIKGAKPTSSTATQKRLGDLLGKLHSMKGAPKAARRQVGALHLYTTDCTLDSEIATALKSLEAGAFRGTDKAWERLIEGLRTADDFAGLPTVLIHPDPGAVNAISSGTELILIDWAGAGYAPRVLGLGLLLFGCTSGKTFNRERVDAIMTAYTEHITLKPAELERLEAAMAHRGLIHEAYSWGVGMARQRKPASMKSWPDNNEGIAALADHIRNTRAS
jgi:Ser/Thr protein kinase RdoA (MazF antagonist)